ncbi:hypothetical protein QJQ45_016278 [Haematococcus lacustris]|nr:hypothetical protein QJQ45_016278 [Haematococcus lacustris]
MQRDRQPRRNSDASDGGVDRELEAQPEPIQAQQNMQASGAVRWARHNNNTWHPKKCKLHTVMRGVSAADSEAGPVVASAVVGARLVQQIEVWVEACSMQAMLGSLLPGLMVRSWFTRVTVLADGQEALDDIPAEAAVIPNLAERNLYLQVCRGLPPPGRLSRPSAAVEAVLAAYRDLHACLDAVPCYEHDANTVDDVGKKRKTSFANSLTVMFPRRLQRAVALAEALGIAGLHEHQRRFGVPLGSPAWTERQRSYRAQLQGYRVQVGWCLLMRHTVSGSGRVLRPTLFRTLTSSEVQKLSAAQELPPKTWPAPHPDDAMLDQRHAAPSASAGGHSARPPSLAHFLDAVLDHAGPEQSPGPPSLAHMLVSQASGPATPPSLQPQPPSASPPSRATEPCAELAPSSPSATSAPVAAAKPAAAPACRRAQRASSRSLLTRLPKGNGRSSSSNSSSMAVTSTSSSTNATSASHAGTSTNCTNASAADVCHTMRMHTRSSSIAGWHASKRGSKVWERDEAAPESSSNGSLVHVAVHVPHGDVMSDGSCPTLRPTTSTTTRVNSAGDTAICSLSSSSSTCSPLTPPPHPCAATRPAPPLPLPLDKLLQLPVYHPHPQLLHGARHQQLLSFYQPQPQAPPPVLPTSMQTQATRFYDRGVSAALNIRRIAAGPGSRPRELSSRTGRPAVPHPGGVGQECVDGVFICLTCAGVHRSLGVHISFVRWVLVSYRRSWREAAEQIEIVVHCRSTTLVHLESSPAVSCYAGKGGHKVNIASSCSYVDDAMFDQAPAPEPVKAPTVAAGTVPAADIASAKAPVSRFAYDTLTAAEPASTVQRGKDGHLTLNTKGGDFFSNPSGMTMNKQSGGNTTNGGSSRREAQGPGQTSSATESTAAQQRFASAKAISSKDFAADGSGETEAERNNRLQRFQGSSAISSADYFGRKETSGSNMDVSAADLVNRLSMQVDDAMFDQAPAPEPVKAPTVAAGTVPAADIASAKAPVSRFAYDTLTAAEPASTVQRGKDGHLTLNTKGGDFFSNPSGMTMNKQSGGNTTNGGSSRREAQGPGQTSSATESTAAQQRFASAKAISSKDFAADGSGETEAERNNRLQRFQGSSAISSADYFGRKETSGSNMDVSAADLVNRLSMQAQQDLSQMSNLAGSVSKKLAGMATKFMSDLGRY